LRTLTKAPKATINLSYKAREVVYFANLLELGVTIDLNDIPGDILYHISYFGSLKKKKEEEVKFEALFKGLVQIAKSLFKR